MSSLLYGFLEWNVCLYTSKANALLTKTSSQPLVWFGLIFFSFLHLNAWQSRFLFLSSTVGDKVWGIAYAREELLHDLHPSPQFQLGDW